MTVEIGLRRWSAFHLMGGIGLFTAVAVGLLAALRSDVNPIAVFGLAAASVLTSLTWMLLRRLVTRSEKMVQLWDTWVAIGGGAMFAWATREPVLPLLDILSIGIATFLVFGRVGCAMVGCCHGAPAGAGLSYGPEHGLSPEFTNRPLFPVQLLESVGMLLIAGGGLALVARAPATALVWFLLAGALLRFGSDAFRGDHRLHIGRLTSVSLMAVLQLTAGLVLSEQVAPARSTDLVLIASIVTVTLAVVVALVAISRQDRNPLTAAAHIAELKAAVERLKPLAGTEDPVIDNTSQEMCIALTADGNGYHLSVSHTEHDAAEAARTLGGTEVAHANGVTHFRLGGRPVTARNESSSTAAVRASMTASRGGQPAGVDDPHAYFESRHSGWGCRPVVKSV